MMRFCERVSVLAALFTSMPTPVLLATVMVRVAKVVSVVPVTCKVPPLKVIGVAAPPKFAFEPTDNSVTLAAVPNNVVPAPYVFEAPPKVTTPPTPTMATEVVVPVTAWL